MVAWLGYLAVQLSERLVKVVQKSDVFQVLFRRHSLHRNMVYRQIGCTLPWLNPAILPPPASPQLITPLPPPLLLYRGAKLMLAPVVLWFTL